MEQIQKGRVTMQERITEFTTSVASAYKKLKKIKRQQTELYASFGIREPHVMCLYFFGEHPEGLTVTELAALCYDDKAATSRAVDYLVEKGYAQHEEDDVKSRWRSKVQLTERGIELAGVVSRVASKVSAVITKGIPPEDVEVFYRVFKQMINNMDHFMK